MHWERKEDDRKRKMAVSQHNFSLLRKLFSGWKVIIDNDCIASHGYAGMML